MRPRVVERQRVDLARDDGDGRKGGRHYAFSEMNARTIPEDAFSPHLRAGELAIVDPDDNEPQAGEIYVITVNSPRDPGSIALHLVQLRAKVARRGWMDEHGNDHMNDETRSDGGCTSA